MAALLDEAVTDTLTGLIKFSVSYFVKVFDFLLHQAKMKDLGTDTHNVISLEQLKTIMSKAVDAYHSLCTACKWHAKNNNVAC